MTKKSLSEELKSLIEPGPNNDNIDIENEDDPSTLATKIYEVDLNDEDKINETTLTPFSKLKKNQIFKLSSSDKRYVGKKIKREDLEEKFEIDNDQEIDDEESFHSSSEDESDDNDEEDDGELSQEDDDQIDDEIESPKNQDLNILNDYDNQWELKANSVKNQLSIYETLIGLRMKLQKLLTISNRLPSKPQNLSILKNEENKNLLNQSLKGLQKIQNSLLEIDSMMTLNTDNNEEEDEKEMIDIKSRKRKITRASDSVLSKRFCLLKKNYPKIIDEWHDRTKLVYSNINLKKFNSFDVQPSKTIEQILMDKDRLIKRTKIKRSDYKIIGAGENQEIDNDNNEDNDIYDDDDFYHVILRQIIENKLNSNGEDLLSSSKKLAEIQRLRSKSKKIVDTKASKGRKLRYDVHEKLVNFMAPNDRTTISDEAKNDLFKSLFGNFKIETEIE